MAVVSSDFLSALLTRYQALFHTDFQAAIALQAWMNIAMTVNSTGAIESYNWLGTPPVMEDVTHGEATEEGLGSYNFSIENAEYQALLAVQRTAIEDDKLGLIQPRVRQLGPEAARHPGQLIYALMEANGNAYDGTAFFANTRVIGDCANIDNIQSGAYGDGTVAEFQAGLKQARLTMRAFQDDKGRPMNLVPNVIMVPPALEETAWQSLNVAKAGTQERAPIPVSDSGTFQAAGYTVMVNPYLTTTDDWYVFHVAGAIKPYVFQSRIKPTLEGITNPNTEAGIVRRKFLYSVRGRYAVGYGEPRHAIKVLDA